MLVERSTTISKLFAQCALKADFLESDNNKLRDDLHKALSQNQHQQIVERNVIFIAVVEKAATADFNQ